MGRKPIDISGQKFGKLTAIKIVEHCGAHIPVKWLCICDCGKEKTVDSQLLRRGLITDCGCSVKDRLVGEKIGRLTVIKNSGKKMGGNIIWECRCDCGKIVEVSSGNLNASRKNATLSCGCLRREHATKHGLHKTKIYKALNAAKDRCNNPNNSMYKNYGGRGIKVCEEWSNENGYVNFYNWSIANGYSDELSIDRIDNNRGYSPDNCRWASIKVQANNTSRNRYVTINGETKSVSMWAEEYGICIGTVRDRIKRGWSDIDAITKPVKRRRPD